MASAAQYKLEEGRRPTFTNPDSIMVEPNGWYRNKGHRRRPGVVRGRAPRINDGRKHLCISYNMHTQPYMRPFGEYLEAYVAGTITQGELASLADLYGALGYKVKH